MKVIVCIKQVPDVAEIRFDAVRRTIVREGVAAIVNPFDRPAIALGARLKQERGAEVTALTMGPERAREALYEALASGLDHAVHLCDRALSGSDTLATARALAAAISREGFDLILCGKYTIDGETAQVGPELGELLGVPHVSGVSKLSWEGERTLLCERESDDGPEVLRVKLPCLLTCAEQLLPPSAVRKPQLDAARERPVAVLSALDLGLSEDQVGLSGSPTWVAEIEQLAPISRPAPRLFRGDPEDAARELSAALREALSALRPPPLLALPEARASFPGPPVLVSVEQSPGGALRPGSVELLGEAARLSEQLGGEAVALLVGGPGSCSEALQGGCAAAGADAVLAIEHPALAPYSSEGHTEAVAAAIASLAPAAILFSSTERGRDLAPRVAARLGLGLTGDAIGLKLNDEGRLVQLKPAFGGHFVAPILSKTTPQLTTVRPGVLAPRRSDPARRARLQRLLLAEFPVPRTELVSAEVTVDERAARLVGARLVVGVGHGIGDPRHLPLLWQLAEALGGAVAATRRVTDKGWLPRQLQVGLTGHVIAPDIYLAIGIRGAPYHAVGIQRTGAIFAINNDEKAPIFQLATAGVVGDFSIVVPALLRELTRGAS